MQYICPDLICPHCEKHTDYVIGEGLCWVNRQTCQNCGKTFKAIMNLRDTPIKSYGSSLGRKIDLENDVFISFNCYIPSKREEELCKIEENK